MSNIVIRTLGENVKDRMRETNTQNFLYFFFFFFDSKTIGNLCIKLTE